MGKNKYITLAHGNGGALMHELIGIIKKDFSNSILDESCDAAEFSVKAGNMVFSTDSYVIRPLFFPGGDIGKLAVFGTVNDIAVKGARPLYISLAFIIEEGFEFEILVKLCRSIGDAAKKAGVKVVTGDIKVVEKGSADKIFINTSGVGEVIPGAGRITSKARPGDVIIINGPIAEHAMAVLEARENLGFKSKIKSDCANVNFMVQKCLKAAKNGISVMRDPTRGGLATTLNEIALSSDLGIEIYEKDIPVNKSVLKFCDVLGFDPLYAANEGKFVCFVNEKSALSVLKVLGKKAKAIGKVVESHKKEVHLITRLSAHRILPMLELDQLPRIC